MITRNGLNLFKILLTNSCPDISAFTDIDGNTNYVTSFENTNTFWSLRNGYYNGNAGTMRTGTFEYAQSTFLPYSRLVTGNLNYNTYTANWSADISIANASSYNNYLSGETAIITIPAGVELGQPTLLGTFGQSSVYFANVPGVTTGTTYRTLYRLETIGIYGTAPSNLEQLTITIPKGFENPPKLNLQNAFGLRYLHLYASLGYGNSAESVDDYDLNSPVYNKKLNPTEMSVKCLDKKIEFTISFKNFESESISVNEFGLYQSSDSSYVNQPIPSSNKISFNGYKIGNNTVSSFTLYDEMYIGRGFRPNLIVRKVLPQTITIPPSGIATFKYTIDLSEMKAQENIVYKQA